MNLTQNETVNLSYAQLCQWITKVLQRCGVSAPQAEKTAQVLAATNLRGIDTHGAIRLIDYVSKIQSGEVKKNCVPVIRWVDNTLFFDGDGGLGQYVASETMALALDRCMKTPVVSCFLRGSGHLAALGMFALQAAERGMVALIAQETPPLMALPKSKGPAIGNNPIAFAMPITDGPPLVFDMATSVVSRGAVLQAKHKNLPLEHGLAIDENGHPTIDPSSALNGAMLPMALHKGIGLAMMVQCLAGSLTASDTLKSAEKFGAKSSAGNVSAFILVINPELVTGGQAFDDHVIAWMSKYLSATGEDARYPGERAAACQSQRLLEGIPFHKSEVAQLSSLGTSLDVPFPSS